MPSIMNKNGWRTVAQLERQIRSVLPDEIVLVSTRVEGTSVLAMVEVDVNDDPRPDAVQQAHAAIAHLNTRLDGALVVSLALVGL